MGTIYLLSPITVISLKAIDLNNRGWNVVTPSDRMLSIILAESEHLDNLGGASALLEQPRSARDRTGARRASAAQQPRHCIRLAQDLNNLGCASALLEQARHCIRLAQDLVALQGARLQRGS